MLDLLELLARPKMLVVIGLFILIVWGASKLPDSVFQWFTENSGIWSIGVFVIGCIAWGLASNRDLTIHLSPQNSLSALASLQKGWTVVDGGVG